MERHGVHIMIMASLVEGIRTVVTKDRMIKGRSLLFIAKKKTFTQRKSLCSQKSIVDVMQDSFLCLSVFDLP